MHLPEPTLQAIKERFCDISSGQIHYESTLSTLDWSPVSKQWLLTIEPASSSENPQHRDSQAETTRKHVLRLITHKLQKYKVDLRVLQAIREQFVRLDTSYTGRLPMDLFELCLSSSSFRLSEGIRKLLAGFCADRDGHVQLEKFTQVLDSYIYTPQDPSLRLGHAATLKLESPSYPLESKFRKTPLESLQLDLTHRLKTRTNGTYAAFKFFDTRQSGKVSVQEFVAGVKRLGVRMEEKDARDLLAQAGLGEKPELTLNNFAEIFGEGLSKSQSPTVPRLSLSPIDLSAKPKRSYVLPSDSDPSHAYGKTNRPSENIRDVIFYGLQRDWALEKLVRDQNRSYSHKFQRKLNPKLQKMRMLLATPNKSPKLPLVNQSLPAISTEKS